MLDHLSNRTRQFVQKLIEGKSVNIGGSAQGPFNEPSRDILRLFAHNLGGLRSLKGGELLTEVQRLANSPVAKEVAEEQPAPTIAKPIPLRLSMVRANSFRGIAPAGMDWDFDFEIRPHLLYGPNSIKQLNDRAAAANSIKDLGGAVRQDTLNLVKSVEPEGFHAATLEHEQW